MALFRLDNLTLITQKCYRSMLFSLSRPGTVCQLDLPFGETFSHLSLPPPLSAIAYTILDEQVTIAPCNREADRWVGELVSCTGARKVPLEQADYVLAVSVPETSHLKSMKQGTLFDPEDAATLVIWLAQEISGTAGTVRISGPGVETSVLLTVSNGMLSLITRRLSVRFEYPMGFEIFVVGADGGLLGLPRTSKLEIVKESGG